MHSVLQTLSFAFVDILHSLPWFITKFFEQCIARRRSEMFDPASWPSKCNTMGSKNTSPLNLSAKSNGSVEASCGIVLTDKILLRMPFVASQSGSTDHSEPSPCWRRRFCHILLSPSATGFSIPGLWRISVMFLARIDSFHLLWWTLIYSLRRQSCNARQSVSISICDP